MARPRKPWRHTEGRYGATVAIYEDRPGAPLRWDYRVEGQRSRPFVEPETFVRKSARDPVDTVLEARAVELCRKKQAEITLEPAASEPARLTVPQAYRLYFDPKRKALPASREARTHHTASRDFWLAEIGEDERKKPREWDDIPPADVWGALIRLKEAGHVPTAEKRLANLRTLYHWLKNRMGYDTLRDPTRTLDKRKLREGHRPRRPRYTKAEVEKLVDAAAAFGERFALFVYLLADSGARAVQVRTAMRSGLDCELEPPPPFVPPCGWLLLPAVKGQDAMLTYLTARQRAAIDAALATYLAEWEADWQESRIDYPLIPGERDDRVIVPMPISDTALRKEWRTLHEAAGVPLRSRRGFHGVRRAWSDDIEEAEGLDTVTAAGGWSRRETPESLYVSKRKYGHLERARRRRESE